MILKSGSSVWAAAAGDERDPEQRGASSTVFIPRLAVRALRRRSTLAQTSTRSAHRVCSDSVRRGTLASPRVLRANYSSLAFYACYEVLARECAALSCCPSRVLYKY